MVPQAYAKNLKTLDKGQKDSKSINIIKINGKNFKKSLFLLLELTQPISLAAAKILKNKIEIKKLYQI